MIAKSARMLVQMCVDSGWEVVAIDCYADSDTRQMAKMVYQVTSLALSDVRAALEEAGRRYRLTELLYGSGLESQQATLVYLENHWRIIGNSAAIFQSVQDKCDFFVRLALFSIPYPEVVYSRPNENDYWLLKPWRGEGGLVIRRCSVGDDAEYGYWQRHIEGRSMSVLFVATSGGIELIGFNEQWLADCSSEHPFMFGGVLSRAEVPDAVQTLMAGWLLKLSAAYGLRGLNSLDFILDEGDCYVLELNARISASAQLYGKSVLRKHLQAFQDNPDENLEVSVLPSAYKIVFARNPVTISEGFEWPSWTADRPNPGSIVATGEPICSIIATGKNSGQVLDNLHRQQRILANLLETGL
ncbi:ATP-grasp domain-containing protein [Methylomonas sp. TEB]|uniref:ATP-grasp domain-containing protein n=1 Tax=Methylomonas sp. TEB TaxID=3398229 RepID=UPI0039F4A3E9